MELFLGIGGIGDCACHSPTCLQGQRGSVREGGPRHQAGAGRRVCGDRKCVLVAHRSSYSVRRQVPCGEVDSVLLKFLLQN